MADGDGVVGVEDEAVILREVAGNVELGGHVVFHFVVVAVQMVRGNVGYDGNVRTEIINVVQLETADFQYIIIKVLGSHLIGVAFADIAAQSYVESCVFQEVINEGGGGGFSVGAGDADFLRGVVAAGEFYL